MGRSLLTFRGLCPKIYVSLHIIGQTKPVRFCLRSGFSREALRFKTNQLQMAKGDVNTRNKAKDKPRKGRQNLH
jgi:hypothetical protein